MKKKNILGTKSSIVENVPTPSESILKLFLAFQHPYRATLKNNQTYNLFCLYRSEGLPERGMGSLRMMGWGLLVVESSSAAVVVAVAVPQGWTLFRWVDSF